MEPYAVISTGGKQYLVRAGETLRVEKLAAAVGAPVELGPVLAASDGTQLRVGKPAVAGAKVTAKVVEHTLADKVVSFKKKRRKGYHRKVGHRQDVTVLHVESVG
jgi:large subunit ribosomal protein L21